MKIPELHLRACSIFKLLHNRAAGPLIRKSIGNYVSNRQAKDDRKADEYSQPMFQSEFSLRSAHEKAP
jgi:hypothetical protein